MFLVTVVGFAAFAWAFGQALLARNDAENQAAIATGALEKLEDQQGKTKEALAQSIKNEQLADQRRIQAEKTALQARFDQFYFRAREEPAVAPLEAPRFVHLEAQPVTLRLVRGSRSVASTLVR